MAKRSQQGVQPLRLGWSGGVNLLSDPKAIRDDQIASGKNMWPRADGILGKREAVTFERVAIANPSVNYKPITMFVPDPVTGFDFVIHYADQNGNEYIRAGAFDSDTEAKAPSAQVAAGAPNNCRPMSFANYRGAVIAVGAGNEGFYQLTQSSNDKTWAWHKVSFDWKSYDPAATQGQAIAVQPQVIGVYRNRLLFANFGVGMGNWVIFADRDGPWVYAAPGDDAHRDNVPIWSQIGADVLASNGNHIEIGVLAGQDIQAIDEVSTQSVANALQQACFIRTKTKAVFASGEVAETTGNATGAAYTQDWAPALANIDAGQAGPHTSCKGPNGIFWASGEDVFALYDGAPRPVALGTNIRPALRAAPQSYQPFWHMAYADGCVYLSIATADSSDELNLSINHWRLDLRPQGDDTEVNQPMGPADARWWGPQDYSSLPRLGGTVTGQMGACIAARRGKDNQDILFGMFYGDVTQALGGATQNLFLVSYNRVFQGRDVPYREVVAARVWAPNEQVAPGDIVSPTVLARTGRLYMNIATGFFPITTGNAEPAWPTDGASIVADNTAVWQEVTTQLRTSNRPVSAGDILMGLDFKELSLGDFLRDKVCPRIDVAAYLSSKQQVWTDVVANGGDLRFFMGPAVMGGPTYRLTGANNDLGEARAGSFAVAKEFQSRSMRPNVDQRTLPAGVGIQGNGVVRGRSLQPRLRDGQGFVIDSSNDYIVWGTHNPGGLGLVMATQSQIPDGYYATWDILVMAIVAAMNATANLIAIPGFTVAANPWEFTNPFTSVVQSIGSINFRFSARTAGYIVGLICGIDTTTTEEGVFIQGVNPGGGDTLVLYTQRSSRLLAMLGFDTSHQYATASSANVTGKNTAGTNITLNFQGEVQVPAVAGVVANIFGAQAVPLTVAVSAEIAEVLVSLGIVPGMPLGLTGR